jgi:hypothetical protein
MKDVIAYLTLKKFDPKKYSNPALQRHYQILQAVALDEEMPELPKDTTEPNYARIHERLGDAAIEWGKALNAITEGVVEDSQKKRKAIDANHRGDGDVKVKREKKSVEPASADKIESLYEQGHLNSVFSSMTDLPLAKIGSIEGSMCTKETSGRENKGCLYRGVGGLFFKAVNFTFDYISNDILPNFTTNVTVLTRTLQ